MKLEIKIDKDCSEPILLIRTDKMTEELEQAIKILTDKTKSTLFIGYKNETAEILEQAQIVRIYSFNKKVYAEKQQCEYILKLRLYELEEILDRSFVRISNSEIVNLKHVKKLDLSLSGTICVYLSNGKTTYASRRYVAKIKQTLGM